MSKKKYRFNPEKLSYELVRESLGKRIFKWFLFVAPSIVMGLVLAFFFSSRLASPKEAQLKQELEAIKLRYAELSTNMQTVHLALDAIEKRDKDLYRVALYADEFPEEFRQMGIGGSDRYAYLSNYSSGQLMRETSEQMDLLEQRILGQSLSLRELQKLAKEKEKLLSCVPAIQPVKNRDLKQLISGFGWRIDPVYKTSRMHTGVDFSADIGADVYATGDGVVEVLEVESWGYGKSIVINHGFGYKTRYAHLSAFKVKQGQKIKRGELIGLVGNTGKSTGPHLHYEVEMNGKKIDPIHFFHSDLSPEEYEKLIEMSQQSYKSFD